MSATTINRIKTRLRHYETSTDSNGNLELEFTNQEENFILNDLIHKAKQDIRMYRHYPDSYTEAQIEADIDSKYENLVIDLVLFDYSTEGADFEKTHNENGVNRTFVTRESILGKVLPFCKVLS